MRCSSTSACLPPSRPRQWRTVLRALTWLTLTSITGAAAQPRLTHGTAIGDVRATSALVWARCADADRVRVVATAESASREVTEVRAESAVVAEEDFTAQVLLTGLEAGTSYVVGITCAGSDGALSATTEGTFRTAPSATEAAAVSFLISGDLGGQTYCRLDPEGYQIFAPMTDLKADFFVANGDMIYADNPCPREGAEGLTYADGGFPGIGDPSVDWTDRKRLDEIYRAHWKYNRADENFQKFLRTTPLYVQWDDHEVINDFGGPWPFYLPMPQRQGYSRLVEAGRSSLFAFHPIERHPKEPQRIYRSFRWGRDLELFLLDARSYRSRNDVVDEGAHGTKTLLGAEQLRWLIDGLVASDATWKIVSSDVPLSVATGSGASAYGRDAYASGTTPFGAAPDFAVRTGFESELLWMLTELDRAKVRNLVFVTTDVHFAAQIRYERDFDADGDALVFHELISGPLSAFKSPSPPALDPTLGPAYLYAEGNLFNFAYVRLSANGSDRLPRLRADVRDETGRVRPGSELELRPRSPSAER